MGGAQVGHCMAGAAKPNLPLQRTGRRDTLNSTVTDPAAERQPVRRTMIETPTQVAAALLEAGGDVLQELRAKERQAVEEPRPSPAWVLMSR